MNREHLSPEVLAEVEDAEHGLAESVLNDSHRGTGIRALGMKHYHERVARAYARHGVGKPDFNAILAMHERRGGAVTQ